MKRRVGPIEIDCRRAVKWRLHRQFRKTPSRIQGVLVDEEGGGDERKCVDPIRIGMRVFALYWDGGESGGDISAWSHRAERGL